MKLNVGVDEMKQCLWKHSDSCMFGKQSLVVYEPTTIKSSKHIQLQQHRRMN